MNSFMVIDKLQQLKFTMPHITFYYAPGACSLAPHILLREAGLEVEHMAATVNQTTVRFPDGFEKINPSMQVPVLSLDGVYITEVSAIATAISNLVPDMHLMGKTSIERVRVYEWMNWLSGTLHGRGFGPLYRPERYTDEEAAFDGLQKKAVQHIKWCYEFIEKKIDGTHAVGGLLTAVDPYLLVFYRWGNGAVGLDMKDYPKYTALIKNLVNRAEVKATLKIEDIDSTL
ncbi:glutathione S-transferase [Bisporella sp. PMI_857]|nr:glutathione S-transferase [Bisporella sp. PMI_857]